MTASQTLDATPDSPGKLEKFTYDDKIVRAFLLATIVWALVAFLVGIIAAIELAFPEASMGIPYITFGRLRPLHTNAAIFAFAGNTIFAGIYYSTQRLCKTRMASDLLSWLHFWGWQLIIVSAALTLPLGITQSKEYAELEWPIDIAIAVVWLVFFGGNFFWTLAKRRERHLYVALWFYIATIVTVTILHVFNNLWFPLVATGQPGTFFGYLKSYPVYAGVQDAFMQWWYGHNAVAFFLTTPFLGLMYYFMPKAADRPVFSYKLSILHFWSLVFIYIWAGPHHLHYTALPEWASTLGMIFSLMLWMPSWGGMINGLLTLRGAWHKVATDPILKFFVVAVTFYGMSTFEGPMLSIKSVNALSHYTDWTIAHVHSGALGWNGFMAFGMMYFLLPRLFQTKLFSKQLAELHFWLATVGILLYIIPIYVAGITQGLMWRGMTDQGQLLYPDFVETVTRIVPMYYLRILGGLCYFAGGAIGFYNFIMTWKARPEKYEEPVHQAPALSATYDDGPPPHSRLKGVTDLGHKIDVFMQMRWHRRWERLMVTFTIWVIISVSVASLFEIIPTFLIRSNVPTIATVTPYTPLELAGRDIYVSEGCYNCHSQMIRPMFHETKRYGEYSKPGESVYDHPFQWGSRRIGPDLAREGGKQSPYWHVIHFRNPRDLVEQSIMPEYSWLETKKVDLKSIPLRVKANRMIGADYTIEDEQNAIEHAMAQAELIMGKIREGAGGDTTIEGLVINDGSKQEIKEVVAVIAYLERLGVDLFKTPDEPATEEAETETADQDQDVSQPVGEPTAMRADG